MTTVPTFDQFIEPLLRVLAEHQEPLRTTQVHDVLAERLGLTAEQRAEVLPSGQQPYYKNRIGWAHDRLKRAGLSESLKRGYWQLTPAGRAFAAKHSRGIPDATLKQLAFRPAKSQLVEGEDDADLVADETEETRTPEERLEAAYEEIRRRVRAELLDVVRQSSPSFFERLVLDLLHAMGYGANRKALTQVGGAGDGGIDGVISLDKLGLEKVYIQAKRYGDDNHVSRPTIQGFFGALAGRRATKGVFITTSRFSKEAREFAATASDSIVLIDGLQLAELMIDHGVGVTRRQSYTLIDVDSDYFESS